MSEPPADLPDPAPPLTRYRMRIAYDGTNFCGWQKQHPPNSEPLRTVQGVVESVVARALWQTVNLVGASRTDSGVHAIGQVAQFGANTTCPVEKMTLAFNSRLPDDIEVMEVTVAPPGFRCIGDAVSKQYRYRVFNSMHRPLDRRHVVYHCFDKPLDVEAMRAAAAMLVGEHDFAGFAQAKHGRVSTVRSIYKCDIEPHPPELHIVVQGSGFLYNMVRIIAGTLVEVGRGRMPVEQVKQAIDKTDRRLAGPTLPASGLWLEWIQYEGEEAPVKQTIVAHEAINDGDWFPRGSGHWT